MTQNPVTTFYPIAGPTGTQPPMRQYTPPKPPNPKRPDVRPTPPRPERQGAPPRTMSDAARWKADQRARETPEQREERLRREREQRAARNARMSDQGTSQRRAADR